MMFGGMMLFGGLLLLVFWVLVIVGVVWLAVTLARGRPTPTASWPHSGAPQATSAPLDIMKTRYAKGEIAKEEFEQMRRDLGV